MYNLCKFACQNSFSEKKHNTKESLRFQRNPQYPKQAIRYIISQSIYWNIDYSKTLNYFYIFSDDKDDPESKRVLDTLENIDDECDK